MLGELEGGEALLFSSGMGADDGARAGAALSPARRSRSREDAYYGTGVLFTELERWGLRHVLFDQTGPPPPGADLVWIEAPSNPLLTMPDFEAAAAHPGLVVCDATAATPVHLRPLEHGCDLVLHSATKYLAGHHDVLLGAVVCKSAEHAARLARAPDAHRDRRGARRRLAARARPEDARGPRQAPEPDGEDPRGAAGGARARSTNVRYPGFGALLSFDVADGARARRVETATTLIVNATSLGGVQLDDGDAPPLGGRSRPGGPAAAVRRARAGRAALARPRAAPWNRRNQLRIFALGRPLNIALEWA